MEERLTNALYRMKCPDPIELGEYQLKMVRGDRARFIKKHLSECPLCAREMAQLQDYLASVEGDLGPSPLEQITGRVKVVIARLVPGPAASSPAGLGALAFAGVRGGEEGPLIYRAGEVELAIEIDEDAGQPDRRMIVGLITGLTDPGATIVHLWQAGEQVQSVPVDDRGNFEITDLSPGSYELIVGDPENEIHIQDLPVGSGR